MSKPHIVLLPIARTTFDIPFANEIRLNAINQLSQLPINLEPPPELITDLESAENTARAYENKTPDLVIILQATFADSSMAMALASQVNAPVLLWGVPEQHTGERLRLNSFCGINLAGHALARSGIQYGHLFASPGAPEVDEKILSMAKAGRALNDLRHTRLGRVGENPEGFETCLFDADLIQNTFGMEIVQFNLEDHVFPQARSIDNSELDIIQAELSQKVTGLDESETTATRGTLSVYAALKHLSEQENLSGYAVRCWPEFFTEMGCAACGAMSMLSDEGIPCSCETDVNGTITQMILQSMSSGPAFGTDMVSLDQERDALVVWHCGLAPLAMANPDTPPGITIHSNRKLPLLFEFTLKPGPVTIARLSQTSGSMVLVIGRGHIIDGPKSFSGTSGLLQFSRPAKDVMDTILSEGLEHHISLTYGDHTDALAAFAKLINIPVLQLSL